MINVYYTKVFPFLEENTFLAQLEKMDERRKNKILRIREPMARSRSIAGDWLLHRLLFEKWGFTSEELLNLSLEYEEGGKPYLAGRKDISFNISHSGDYACCAIGEAPVGIDLQKKVPVRERLWERFFTAADNQKLQECSEKEREALFFRMWSIKESYMKLTGKGIRQGLDTFEIDWQRGEIREKGEDSPAAYFTEQDALAEYSFCLCVREEATEVQWKEIEITM